MQYIKGFLCIIYYSLNNTYNFCWSTFHPVTNAANPCLLAQVRSASYLKAIFMYLLLANYMHL